MRSLHRIRVPSKITNSLKGTHLKNKLLNLLTLRIQYETGVLEKFKVPSKWKLAKKQLLEESSGKCAFCECEIPSHQHGDVEHYRPKSIYWWLAYTIDNFLLSCEICNQRKSNTFDIRNERISCGDLPILNDLQSMDSFVTKYVLNPSSADFDDLPIGLKKLKLIESPQLLNPYIDEVEKYFMWKYDKVLKEVEIDVNLTLSNAEQEDAKYTITLLDLNRVPLKRRRYRELLKLTTTIKLGATFEQVKELYLDRASEFSAMNQFITKDLGLQ